MSRPIYQAAKYNSLPSTDPTTTSVPPDGTQPSSRYSINRAEKPAVSGTAVNFTRYPYSALGDKDTDYKKVCYFACIISLFYYFQEMVFTSKIKGVVIGEFLLTIFDISK